MSVSFEPVWSSISAINSLGTDTSFCELVYSSSIIFILYLKSDTVSAILVNVPFEATDILFNSSGIPGNNSTSLDLSSLFS